MVPVIDWWLARAWWRCGRLGPHLVTGAFELAAIVLSVERSANGREHGDEHKWSENTHVGTLPLRIALSIV